MVGNIKDKLYWKYNLQTDMTVEDMQISRNAKKLYAITKNPP
jgi:hypothetical protein